MNEATTLHALIDQLTEPEPPLGPVVTGSLRRARTIRRQRRVAAVAGAATVAAVAAILPAAYAGHHPSAGAAAPAAHGVRMPYWPQAYLPDNVGVLPLNTRTNTPGRAIDVGRTWQHGVYSISMTPDGKAAYVSLDSGQVYVINLATGALAARLSQPVGGPIYFSASYQVGYALSGTRQDPGSAIVPINTADNQAGPPIALPLHDPDPVAAMAAGGRTFVVAGTSAEVNADSALGRPELLTVDVATGKLAGPPVSIAARGAQQILISPSGKTAIVLGNTGAGYGAGSITQVSLGTHTARPAVRLPASGIASMMVFGPGGTMVYVVTSSAIVPVDLTTNKALAPILLPSSLGDAYGLTITPDGRKIYVFLPRGVHPLLVASRRSLPAITVPGMVVADSFTMLPNGKTLYVGTGTGVIPISTATDTAGRNIPMPWVGAGQNLGPRLVRPFLGMTFRP